MLQDQEKLWKQLRNQEENQHHHAEVRQHQVRQCMSEYESKNLKDGFLFLSNHLRAEKQTKKKIKQQRRKTDHLNVFQNNGFHIFESEGQTDGRTGDAQKTPRVSPQGSEEDEESLCYLLCERKTKPLPRSPAMLTQFIENRMDRGWS